MVGQWEQCSQSCGPGGVQQRAVVCEKVLANGQMMAVASNQCPLPKPLTAQPCNVHINCPEWEMGNWSQVKPVFYLVSCRVSIFLITDNLFSCDVLSSHILRSV